jgi:hypothetical protein
MTRRIPLVTALALAGPVAFTLSACAALRGNQNDTGYGNSSSSLNQACHDEVLRRYGDLRSSDVSTRGTSNSNNSYDTRVDWRTNSGGAGSCMVSSSGSITGFREDRSPYANGNYSSSDQGGWTNNSGYGNNGDNSNTGYSSSSELTRSQLEACRNQVMKEYQGLAAGDVRVNVQATDERQTSAINWSTNRGDSGTCIVNRKMEIATFNKNNR